MMIPLPTPINVKLGQAHGYYKYTPSQRLESPPPNPHALLIWSEQQWHAKYQGYRKTSTQFFLGMKRAIYNDLDEKSQRKPEENTAGRSSEADLHAFGT